MPKPDLSRARAVMLALLSGHSRAEIAEILGVSRSQAQRLVARLASAPHGNDGRMVGARIHKAQLKRLDGLARKAGVTRQVMASRLIAAALSMGPDGPARLLGREGRPRRRYARKRPAIADNGREWRHASIPGNGGAFGEASGMEVVAWS